MTTKYAPVLPMYLNNNGSIESITEPAKNAKQKLKTILYTNPGEKIFNPNFGVGIRRLLFETFKDGKYLKFSYNTNNEYETRSSYIEQELQQIITDQVDRYLPEVSIKNIEVKKSNEINDAYNIIIYFTYASFYNDNISINVTG